MKSKTLIQSIPSWPKNIGVRLLSFFFLFSTVFFITSCSTSNTQKYGTAHSGRIAITSNNSEMTPVSTSFLLTQDKKYGGSLLIFSPFGNIVASLAWSSNSASLEMNGQFQKTESLHELLEKLMPGAPPAQIMMDWLSGLPTPHPDWSVHRTRNLVEAKLNDAQGYTTTVKVLIEK
jgi:outer membrane biogenesis lipoprotein LolB